MKNKVFTAYFPTFSEASFGRDVGIIPLIFKRYLNYEVTIICYRNESCRTIADENGIKLVFMDENYNLAHDFINTDILYVVGCYDFNLDIIEKYKKINPDGKVYMKLDMNLYWLSKLNFNEKERKILQQVTVTSSECKNIHHIINNVWPTEVKLISNGYYGLKDDRIINYSEKENIILTVGRLGSFEKATETLLEAFRIASDKIPTWKLKLVGTMEKGFEEYYKKFFDIYPELKGRVIYEGPINDRAKLEEEYRKAKIFALTSRCEGYPNVFPEAAVKGCYILSTDVDPAYDITKDRRFGSIVPIDNILAIANEFIEVGNNEARLEEVCKGIQVFCRLNYNWINQCYKIDSWLNNY